MRYIYLMLENYLAWFKQTKPKVSSDANLGKVSFSITNNSDKVKIECEIPELNKNITNSDIVFLAEKYAMLLTAISSGELNDSIYKEIKNHANKNIENLSLNEMLFFENVVTFWTILYKEKKYNKIKKIEQQFLPIIKPSQVFNS